MKMRRKTYFLALLAVIILVIAYFGVQWNYISTTNDVPYKNLPGTDNCLIYFNIKHEGIVYPVIYKGSSMYSRLSKKNKFLALFSSLYLNEIIKRNWSITVDDNLFSEFESSIVRKDLIEKYQNKDVLMDTTIIANNRIKYHLAGEQYKAILYTLLKNGINCCQDDETGVIIVGDN
jgi:hypothetical protein